MADVWIPSNPVQSPIARGSGIVSNGRAYRGDGNKIEVYYEGDLYGAVNMRRYVERVAHAWDRLTQRYPTVARGVFLRHELHWIGTYNVVAQQIVLESEGSRRALAAWLQVDQIPDTELSL